MKVRAIMAALAATGTATGGVARTTVWSLNGQAVHQATAEIGAAEIVCTIRRRAMRVHGIKAGIL